MPLILNKEQKKAVEVSEGPLLIVAGPGSGKTRVLTSRIAEILNRSPDSNVLAVTFTNKAASEIKERIYKECSDVNINNVWVGTFHSVCLRFLRAYPSIAPVNPGFTIADDNDCKNILKNILKDAGLQHDSAEVKKYQTIISSLKNNNHQNYDNVLKVVEVYNEYEKILERSHCIDFDDIIVKALHMLRLDSGLSESLRKKFNHVLVDEFQDTNMSQYEVIKILGKSSSSICVVGDFDQSIYSWRGGSPEALSWFTSDFPDCFVVTLSKNYRSSSNIVNVCKSIIQDNYAPYRSDLAPTQGDGPPISFTLYATDREEARKVIESYQEFSGSSAVIFRINAQSRLFEEELARKGLAYNMVGSLKFYERAEIKDIISYLRIVVNPNDFLAYSRAIAVPKRSVGKITLEKLQDSSQNFNFDLIEASLKSETFLPLKAGKNVKKFGEEILEIKNIVQSEGIAAGCVVIYENFLKNSHKDDPDRLENLGEFISAARLFESDSSVLINNFPIQSLPKDHQLAAFLENISLSSGADTAEDSSVITLITAHASKGREFNNVWVVGLEESIFPHFFAEDKTNIEEERRLLYVAASRARENLSFTAARKRMFYGRDKNNSLSRFLESIKPHVSNNKGSIRSKNIHDDTYEKINVSDIVRHVKFGHGVVTDVQGDTATVSFHDSVRLLSLRYAKLKVINK